MQQPIRKLSHPDSVFVTTGPHFPAGSITSSFMYPPPLYWCLLGTSRCFSGRFAVDVMSIRFSLFVCACRQSLFATYSIAVTATTLNNRGEKTLWNLFEPKKSIFYHGRILVEEVVYKESIKNKIPPFSMSTTISSEWENCWWPPLMILFLNQGSIRSKPL